MNTTEVIFQVKCENPECQKTFKMARPTKGGIYKISCPSCRQEMRVRIPDPQPETSSVPAPSVAPAAPAPNAEPAKTQVIHFSDDALRYPAQLELVRRFRRNIVFELKSGENVIGRKDDARSSDISIEDDMGISRRSVSIDVTFNETGYHFKLRVLKTKNPVKRNGTELHEGDAVSLKYDDTIVLGGTTFKFVRKK